MEKIGYSIQELQADADGKLWQTQKEYEECIILLAEIREAYASAIIGYESKTAKAITSIMEYDSIKITTAREMAKDHAIVEREILVKLEQKKKSLQGFADALRERLNTIKIIMRQRAGDFQ